MADNQLFYVGQKAFIRKGNELLLLVDPVYGLDLPGGRIQEGESNLTEALQREIEEEIGLEIEIGKPMVTWTWNLKVENKPTFLIGHDCTYLSGEIKLSDEHSDYRWVTQETYRAYIEQFRIENPEICIAIDDYFTVR